MTDKFSEYRKEKKNSNSSQKILILISVFLFLGVIGVWSLSVPKLINNWSEKEKIEHSIKITSGITLEPDEMMITYLNVGQGDCVFIQTANRKTILIDGGEGNSPDFKFAKRVGAGRNIIAPFLKARGIKKIDYVVATHPHSDHIGGLYYILKNFKVGKFYDSGYTKNASSLYKKILKLIKNKNINYNIAKTGEKLNWGKDIYVEVLEKEENPSNTNNSSIVLYLRYKDRKFIFTGDAETQSEYDATFRYGKYLDCDIYYAGHHGSKTSSSDLFLSNIKPEYTVISVGDYNTFGHPAPAILKRLKKYNIKIYRTDKDGSIFVKTNGEKMEITTEF